MLVESILILAILGIVTIISLGVIVLGLVFNKRDKYDNF